MPDTSLVAIGLFINSIGALAIALPDLPETAADELKRRIPLIRKRAKSKIETTGPRRPFNPFSQARLTDYHKSGAELSIHYSGESMPRNLYSSLNRIWPLLYQKNEKRYLNFDDVSHLEWKGTEYTVKLIDDSGNELNHVNLYDLNKLIDEHINRILRLFGYIMLVFGFSTQLVGTVY